MKHGVACEMPKSRVSAKQVDSPKQLPLTNKPKVAQLVLTKNYSIIRNIVVTHLDNMQAVNYIFGQTSLVSSRDKYNEKG